MRTIRPEATGRSPGTTAANNIGFGHNRGPPLDTWIELERIIGLKEAARLSGLSIDSIKRHHASRVVALSPRRRGMRLRDALSLSV